MKANHNKNLNEYNHFKKNVIKLNKTKNLFSSALKLEKEKETYYDRGIFNYIYNNNFIQSFYLKGVFQGVKLEPSKTNREILTTMKKENMVKLNENIKDDPNYFANNTRTFRNNILIDTESVYIKNSPIKNGKLNSDVVFPQILTNNNKSLSRFNSNELNERDKENSTFQETRSLDLIEKSGIYNTVKSERSVRSINNYNNINSNFNSNSPRKGKKNFNLYTNSNPGYNLGNSNNPNQIGNTFITFPNLKIKRNDSLQQSQNKNSPLISREFLTNKNEERLIKKIHETNLNTTTTNQDNHNVTNNINNKKENVSFTASDQREFEKVIIKEKKDANNPLMSKQYYHISSFENKLNAELARLSRSYGKIEARGKFSNDLLEKYIEVIPDFDRYKIVKLLNNKENYKFKLLPMVINKKNGFEKLGMKFFNNLKHSDPEYYDINKEWEDYLTKVKDSKMEEENKLNSINFDFSKDYKKFYEEEQSNLDDNVKYSQAGISSNKFFDARNLKINKDKNIELEKISVEKYNENEEEYKLV